MSVTDHDNLSLIKKAASGDSGAFASLFAQHYSNVFNYVLWLSGDPDLAEDITQEAFINAHRALPRLRPPFNLKAWLCRTAHNLFINEAKRRGPVVPLDSDTKLKAIGRDPERELLFAELSNPVRTALKRLSPHHREALVLREVEGFEYADIADIMGVSLDNVKVLLHRARYTFKQNYHHPIFSEEALPTCEVLQELLDAAHDRNVTPDQDATIKQHIADCVTCQKREQALAFLTMLFLKQSKLKPPDGFQERVLGRLHKLGKPGQKAGLKPYLVAGLVGLGVMAIIAWALLGPSISGSSSSGIVNPSGDTPTSTAGSQPFIPIQQSAVPSACEPGWLPASGCTCCSTTLVCADGTVAEFNPACGVGGDDVCANSSCGDGLCRAECGENITTCAADCHI